MKWFFVLCLVCGIGWMMVHLGRWSGALAGTVGLGVLVCGAYMVNPGVMFWGAGLFLFSSLLFIAGGGLAGR